MRNLTITERAIVVGVVLTMLLGAGVRYHRASSAASDAAARPSPIDAEG